MSSALLVEPSEPVLGITGGGGFLGWHLRARAHALGGFKVINASPEIFSNGDTLRSFVESCDAIVHLAGLNRGDDHEIEKINVDLCQQLASAIEAHKRDALVIFANSTHFQRDTAYGRSKRRGAEEFALVASNGGFRFLDLVLPQIFGEYGQPFYNSVVATFCHQLAAGEPTRLIKDNQLELVHAQVVAAFILEAVQNDFSGFHQISGRKMLVSDLLTQLQSIAESYNHQLIPPLKDEFDLALFNTFRACRFPTHYPVMLELRSDARGRLFEGVRSLHGGQCFISTTKPGVTRGNHYHLKKFERFLVVNGEAVIKVRKLFTDKIFEYRVSGMRPAYVDMPTMHTHSITNIGDGELITLFWSHEIFDASRADTFPELVAV